MMTTVRPSLIEAIVDRKSVTDRDVLSLRRDVFADGVVSREEAEWLFAIDTATGGANQAFTELFVEALTDLLVWQETPTGKVSEEAADWLISHITADDRVHRASELALLVNIIEDADEVPAELSAFALHQVKCSVISGEGPAVAGRAHSSRCVDAMDVALMTRILHGAGGPGGLAITGMEAEILFDIADACADSANHPSFDLLFVRAIANHLLGAQPRRVGVDGAAPEGVAGLRDLLSAALDAARSPHRTLESAAADFNAANEAAIIVAERVEAAEAAWLEARILADGKVTDAERALLRFIEREAGSIDQDAKGRLARVA